jgi:hypothetical protein
MCILLDDFDGGANRSGHSRLFAAGESIAVRMVGSD